MSSGPSRVASGSTARNRDRAGGSGGGNGSGSSSRAAGGSGAKTGADINVPTPKPEWTPGPTPAQRPGSPDMPFMTPCTQFECETVEPQCWLEPPRTDAEWDEALKYYGYDRPSELDPSVREGRSPLAPTSSVYRDVLIHHDNDPMFAPSISLSDDASASPSAHAAVADAVHWDEPRERSQAPQWPLNDDWCWPPPSQSDSFTIAGGTRTDTGILAPASTSAPAAASTTASVLASAAAPTPPEQHHPHQHQPPQSPFPTYRNLVERVGLPRQVNPSEDEGNLSAEAERARLRAFYEEHGWLPAPKPSRSTRHRRATALCRLGMSSDDESGARYAVISKYAELLALMFGKVRAGVTIFRGDEEIVYLSHMTRRSTTFPGYAALSGHSTLSPEWQCWVCSDMDKDWRFKNHPNRASPGAPCFFASAPLRYHHPDRDTIDFGALVVVSPEPRDITPREQAMLLSVSSMLVFQLATLQSEIMAKRASAMYESSINFLRRSTVPEQLRPMAVSASTDERKKHRVTAKKRHTHPHARHHTHGTGGPRNPLHSPHPFSSPSPAPSMTRTPSTPPMPATKTGPRDAKNIMRRDLETEVHLFNDAATTLRGILQADAVAMVDLHEFQLFVRRTTSQQQTTRSKESIIGDFLQGQPWQANMEPVVNFVPRYSDQGVNVLGHSADAGMEFDFTSHSAPQTLCEFIKSYLVTRHFWWDREDESDELGKRIMMFVPHQGQTVLATVFMTFTGQLRYATFAVWSRPPSTFDDSSRLALPFVWIIGAALMSSLAILRVKAIEESQITYSNLQAHELRTPLHQILAITQLLRSSISEFAEAPVTTRDTSLNTLQQVRDLLPLLDAIDTSGTTLHGIVENILTFLDLSTKDNRWSGVPGNPNVINRMGGPQTLTAMIEELIHAMSDDDKRGRFGSGQPTAQIETIFEIIPHGLGENVTEDYGGALRRALARVIHNAYRYIDTRGCVQITVDNVKSMLPPEGCERLASTRRIVITVTDNGHGMSQDFVREKLGEPWAKEDLYATGSGLSVHLAYRIIDLMNGEMEITSASGSGCAVTIEVPLPVSRIPHSPVAMFTGRKVALVGFDRGDNDPTHLDRLGKSLANQYHKHGCEIVSSEEADLVVVDGSMEEHPTGLAEVARLSAPEVVILAASAEDEHQIVAAMSGPTRHVRRLIKPVTPTLICQTLQEVSSAPMTPMDDPDAPTRRRPRFDTSAGRNADRPSPPGSWRPGSVGVEDAVASLSLGDYFSSRNRGGSRISSVGSAGSEISPDTVSTVGTGVVPPLDSVESADSRWPAPDLATSTITTPSEDSPEVAADTPPSSGPTPDPRVPTKVLVVEDNIINRKILVKILKASPLPFLQIIEAEDGVDAVERFREFGAPAIVLLDINMPRMDGYAAAIEMRMIEKRRVAAAAEAAATAAVKTAPSTIGTLAISPSPSSPGYMTPMCRSKIIAVTALSGEDERHRGLVECGMDQWLTKPCHKPTLQKVVDQARQELAACGF